MKTLFLSFSLLMLGLFSVQAQVNSSQPQIGVKGGINLATATGSDLEDLSTRSGFNIGLLAEMPMGERFSLQPEIYYSQQGLKGSESDLGTVTYKLDYIQVPVLAKFYVFEGLNLQVGPQIGYKINDNISLSNDSGSVDIDLDDDSKVKDFDAGVVAGVEYKFDMGFFINGRYNYGITEMVKDVKAHNSVVQIGVGFMF